MSQVEHEINSIRAMVDMAEAAIGRQRSIVEQSRRGQSASPLAELELRVLEDILRRHKDRLRNLQVSA